VTIVAVEAFGWDRQGALDDRAVVGTQHGGVAEQGLDGG
jgi:hypothetical protein